MKNHTKPLEGCPKSTFHQIWTEVSSKRFSINLFHNFVTIFGGSGGLRDVLWMALEESQISLIFRDFLGPPEIKRTWSGEGDSPLWGV